MDVTISQFRRDLFGLVNQALDGQDVWISYKGRRIKIAPDEIPVSRLSRITRIDLVRPDYETGKAALREEMEREWEKDWAAL